MAKSLSKSRTLALIGSVVTLLLIRALSKYLPSDVARSVAEALSDELIGLLATAATLATAWLKRQDYLKLAELEQQLALAQAKAEEPRKSVADILAIPPKKRRKEASDA